MEGRCIAYLEDGSICGRPAYVIDPQRGGLVCGKHAPRLPATSVAGVGDINAPVGTRPWAIALRDDIRLRLRELKDKVDSVYSATQAMQEHGGWRVLKGKDGQPFSSYRAFCEAAPPFGLGYSAREAEELAARWKSIWPPQEQ